MFHLGVDFKQLYHRRAHSRNMGKKMGGDKPRPYALGRCSGEVYPRLPIQRLPRPGKWVLAMTLTFCR